MADTKMEKTEYFEPGNIFWEQQLGKCSTTEMVDTKMEKNTETLEAVRATVKLMIHKINDWY